LGSEFLGIYSAAERFELSPGGQSLTYRFELMDSRYLLAPVTGAMRWSHARDIELTPIECELDNAQIFVRD
jgi:hypothetical protein